MNVDIDRHVYLMIYLIKRLKQVSYYYMVDIMDLSYYTYIIRLRRVTDNQAQKSFFNIYLTRLVFNKECDVARNFGDICSL
jgi:hypothetical protein